jgi:hypothetical protein
MACSPRCDLVAQNPFPNIWTPNIAQFLPGALTKTVQELLVPADTLRFFHLFSRVANIGAKAQSSTIEHFYLK